MKAYSLICSMTFGLVFLVMTSCQQESSQVTQSLVIDTGPLNIPDNAFKIRDTILNKFTSTEKIFDIHQLFIDQGYRGLSEKALDSIYSLTHRERIVIYSLPNFQGDSMIIYQGKYFAGSFKNFPRIGSLRVPFGVCTDINYLIKDESVVAGPMTIKIDQMNAGKDFQFGDYNTMHGRNFSYNVTEITVYPWTDFYLSTDDPAVPSAIEKVFVGWKQSTDGSSGRVTVDGKMNDMSKKYVKTLQYKIPKNSTVNVELGTLNGDAGWGHYIKDSILTVNIWVKIRTPFGPRNWVGVKITQKDYHHPEK